MTQKTNIFKKTIDRLGLADDPAFSVNIDKALKKTEEDMALKQRENPDAIQVAQAASELLSAEANDAIVAKFRTWARRLIQALEVKSLRPLPVAERVDQAFTVLDKLQTASAELFDISDGYMDSLKSIAEEIRHNEMIAASTQDRRSLMSLTFLKRDYVRTMLLKNFADEHLLTLVEETVDGVNDLYGTTSNDLSALLDIQKIFADRLSEYRSTLSTLGCDDTESWLTPMVRKTVLSYAVKHVLQPRLLKPAVGALSSQSAEDSASDMLQIVAFKLPVPDAGGFDLTPFLRRIEPNIWSGLKASARFSGLRIPVATIRIDGRYLSGTDSPSLQGTIPALVTDATEPDVVRVSVIHFVSPEMIEGLSEAYGDALSSEVCHSAEPWEFDISLPDYEDSAA